jgi:acetylornithine deacetylase/succinyl-diaminopimelate desuccinylase-like protein
LLVATLIVPTLGVAAEPGADYDSEMRQLAARPEIGAAFETILALEPRTRTDHIELTQIPSPPFGEELRARRYVEMLREAGVESVEIDAEGNVIARRAGTGDGHVVALAAHMDTVFPEGTDVEVRIEGDKLMAPGIGDDTRGMIVVLTVLRALNQARVRTEADLLFIGTVGEEGLGDLRGVKHLFREDGPRIDSWIAVDGGGADRVVHGGIGSHRYRVTFKGPGGHSWGAFGLGNPAHALSRAVFHFDEQAAELVATGPKTSYNIGRIGGGTSVNSIPFEAWLEVDMRSGNPESLAAIDAVFHEAVARALAEQNEVRRDGDPLTVDLEMVGDRPSGSIDPQSPIVQRAAAATRFFGLEPRFGSGSTDSNFPISRGLPAITIGRGGKGGGGHSLREWWTNEDGHIAIQRALLIVVAEAGLAKEEE